MEIEVTECAKQLNVIEKRVCIEEQCNSSNTLSDVMVGDKMRRTTIAST